MEVMVVVAIIGMSAAIAAPALMEAMANRRAGEATQMLVRVGARARAEAAAFGRAHLLVYSDASTGTGGTYGSVQLWRGRVDRCTANDWPTIVGASCGSDPNCIDMVDMGSYAYPTHRVQMRMDGASTGALCFEPNGEMYFQSGAGLFTTTPPAGTDGVAFTFTQLNGASPVGVQRHVVFPFGGTPRIAR